MLPLQPFSYHTHTTFSDGINTAEEMLKQAVKLGWQEIGIADHLVVHSKIQESYCWPNLKEVYRRIYFDNFDTAYEKASRHIEYIRKLSKLYPLKILIGFEVDYFPSDSWLEDFTKLRSKLDIDYLITGNHFFLDENGNDLTKFKELTKHYPDAETQNKIISEHFKTIAAAIRSGLFDFVAHLDYARKCVLCGEFDFMDERREIIRALAETGVAVELNTSGLRKGKDFYPARWMLEELREQNVPLIISDDAHSIDHLGLGFIEAEALLSELNYTNRWKLK